MNATSTVAASLWLAIAVGTPHPSSAAEEPPVVHGQRGASAAAIEQGPFAPLARHSPRATDVGLRVAGTLDSPPALAGATTRHTAQAARSQVRGMRSLAQAERAPQAATAGAVDASAPTEEQYRMYKGFVSLDLRNTIFKIVGDATARLPVDEFKRIDPAEGMAVCRIVIDYNTFRGVMTEAFLAAFGRDTMDSLYKRLIFDMAGIRYGPTKELNGEEKSRLMSALKGLKDGIRDMTEILLEKGRACLGGEVVATEQIGLVSANQFVDRRASEAMEEKVRVLYANQLPLIGGVRDHIPALPERERLEEFIEGLHGKYALQVP